MTHWVKVDICNLFYLPNEQQILFASLNGTVSWQWVNVHDENNRIFKQFS